MRNTKLAVPRGAAFALVSLLGIVVIGKGAADEPSDLDEIRALLVTGGCCHDHENQTVILTSGISERCRVPIEWTVSRSSGSTSRERFPLYADPTWAEGYDVVLHNECAPDNREAAWVERILAPHREGTPAVLIHGAIKSYLSEAWFDFCGAKSVARGPERPFNVIRLDASHAVMQGFGASWVAPQGELLFIDEMRPTATPLAHSLSPKRESFQVNVWTNLYGPKKTRVFATSIGHHNETMLDPKYLNLVTRGMLWSIGPGAESVFREIGETDVEVPFGPPSPSTRLTAFPKNLLLETQATASSTGTPQMDSSMAIDGDHATRWTSAGRGRGEWWLADFGEPTDVGAVALHWEKNAPYQYRIDVSKDGKKFKTLVDCSESTAPNQISVHEIAAPGTQKIRIMFMSGGGGGRASLREVAAYGDSSVIEAIEMAEIPSPMVPDEVSELPLSSPAVGEAPDGVRVADGYLATLFTEAKEVAYVKSVGSDTVFYSTTDKVVKAVDTDADGQADERSEFVKNMVSPRGLEWDGLWLYVAQSSGLTATKEGGESRTLAYDLSVSGITLGIDGWLYCAIDDQGAKEAIGADGTSLEFQGSGVVRIRPDGSGMHVFSRGTYSLYDIAVSPMLDAFSRGEMNATVGWQAQLHHFTGLGHHGYPNLFRHFSEEIAAPISMSPEGVGRGAAWFDGQVITADLLKNRVYRHEIEPRAASFKESALDRLVELPRPTDVDAGVGGLFVASLGVNDGDGSIIRVTRHGRPVVPVPDDPLDGLNDARPEVRLLASRELLRRNRLPAAELAAIAEDSGKSIETRTAALFTLAQGSDVNAEAIIGELASQGGIGIRRMAVRALGDLPEAANHTVFSQLGKVDDPGLQREMIFATARTKSRDSDLAKLLLQQTRNDDALVQRTATAALVELRAVRTCLETLKDPGGYQIWPGAARVLGQIPDMTVVYGLIDRLQTTGSSIIRTGAVKALARLRHREAAWDRGFWSETPNTDGPYVNAVVWEGTKHIDWELKKAFNDRRINKSFLLAEFSRNHIPVDSISKVLDIAAIDPELELATINLILGSDKVPDEALPFLTFIATNENRPGELRLLAATALSKADDDLAIDEACRVVCQRKDIESIPQVRDELWQAFVENSAHGKRHEWFFEQAYSGSETSRVLAWSVLLQLRSNVKSCDEATRNEIRSVLERSSQNPAHLSRILTAIHQSQIQEGADVVKTALQSDDVSIREAAENVAEELNLEF